MSDPESIMPALAQEPRDAARHELPADRDRPSRAEYEPDDPPLRPTAEQRELIRGAFAHAEAVARAQAEAARRRGEVLANLDVFADAVAAPSVHTCHAECPCQTGGQPVGDFIGDGRSYWDDAYREWLELDR